MLRVNIPVAGNRMHRDARPTILFLSQVYVPDPASVGQHMADAAKEMASRGYRVVVLTARRGYDDPSMRYPAREEHEGVEIRRIRFSSFGKSSIAMRLLGAAGFVSQAIWWGIRVRDLEGIVFTTSPPLAGISALALAALRRVPLVYWVMDINPDQYVAMHPKAAGSLKVRALAELNRRTLASSKVVVALDDFMAATLRNRCPKIGHLEVMPPWPHEDYLEPVAHADNPMRAAHGLNGRVVVMYSGNHSPANPLSTFLEASQRFFNDPRIAFCFVGGGAGKAQVDELIATLRPSNVLSLPYQPLDKIRYSLSAADVHLVTLGDPLVGIIHPCKIYGAMAVGRPVLYVGPKPSHVSEIIERERIGWSLRHGDVDGIERVLRELLEMKGGELKAMGARAREAVQDGLSKKDLTRRFGDAVASALENGGAPPVGRQSVSQPTSALMD